MSRLFLSSLILIAALLLSGCESKEEKAERFYQSGMALLAAGDVDRALVEFRNVFKYNGFHKEARKVYADTVLARGDVAEAYGQYLRLIEQYPDTVPVRVKLTELAIANGNWTEAERHGQAAIKLAPDETDVKAIAAALAYRQALLDKDSAAEAVAVEQARAVRAELPDNGIVRRVLIDFDNSRSGSASGATVCRRGRGGRSDGDRVPVHALPAAGGGTAGRRRRERT